jgi:hypothetical protein
MIECVCCKNSLTFTIYSGSDRADQNILHSDVVIVTAILIFVLYIYSFSKLIIFY